MTPVLFGQRFAPTLSSVAIDSTLGVATVRIRGQITLQVVEAAVLELIKHPDFTPGMPAVWDLRGSNLNRLSTDDLRRIAVFNTQHSAERGIARVALVSSEDADYGVARMFEVIGAVPNLEFRTFREPDEARSWISQGLADPA